jgi:hypothetical protein
MMTSDVRISDMAAMLDVLSLILTLPSSAPTLLRRRYACPTDAIAAVLDLSLIALQMLTGLTLTDAIAAVLIRPGSQTFLADMLTGLTSLCLQDMSPSAHINGCVVSVAQINGIVVAVGQVSKTRFLQFNATVITPSPATRT